MYFRLEKNIYPETRLQTQIFELVIWRTRWADQRFAMSLFSIITLAKLRSYIKRNGVCANRFRNTSTAKFNGQYFGTAKPHHLIDQ